MRISFQPAKIRQNPETEKYFLQNENICTRVHSILDFAQLNPRRISLHRNILPINKRRTSHQNNILQINKWRILHHYNILPTNNRRIKSPATAPFHFRFIPLKAVGLPFHLVSYDFMPQHPFLQTFIIFTIKKAPLKTMLSFFQKLTTVLIAKSQDCRLFFRRFL